MEEARLEGPHAKVSLGLKAEWKGSNGDISHETWTLKTMQPFQEESPSTRSHPPALQRMEEAFPHQVTQKTPITGARGHGLRPFPAPAGALKGQGRLHRAHLTLGHSLWKPHGATLLVLGTQKGTVSQTKVWANGHSTEHCPTREGCIRGMHH